MHEDAFGPSPQFTKGGAPKNLEKEEQKLSSLHQIKLKRKKGEVLGDRIKR